MPDHAMETLLRIALVFGEETAVAHVREAMAGQVEIVYASAASEFDAARLASAGAASALVNLDGGDWLDGVESALHAAGVAVVYNDPEISLSLEGWARARWLRHLVAKLRGSRDVDPPRPDAAARAATAGPAPVAADPGMAQVAATADESAFAMPAGAVEAVPPAAVVELPLSSKEIETMTVDFVDGQVSVLAPAVEPSAEAADDAVADLDALPLDDLAQAEAAEPGLSFEPALEGRADEAATTGDPSEAVAHGAIPSPGPVHEGSTEPSVASREPPGADASPATPEAFDFEAEAALDVDTEALSAMIDARLAEPASAQDQDSDQVWREVSGDAVAPAQQDEVGEAGSLASGTRVSEPAAAPAPVDDADVLASLPSLDDWALVDLDAVPAAAPAAGARKSPEPVLSDAFAGLELVPMETIVPVRVDVEPGERWFGGSPAAAGANDAAGSKMKEVSHERG